VVAGVDHGGGIDEDCRQSLPRRFLLRIFLQRGQYHAVDRSESGAMQWTEAPNSNPRCSLQCLEGTPWVVGRKNGRHRPKWPSWWGRETLPILRRTCVGLSTRIIFCCSSDATGKKWTEAIQTIGQGQPKNAAAQYEIFPNENAPQLTESESVLL